MGLKDILEKIAREQDHRIKEIALERKRKIAKMTKDTGDEIRIEKKRMQSEFAKEQEIYRNLKLSEAKRNVRRHLLAEKEGMINRTLENVLEEFGNFKGEGYRKILGKLVTVSVDLLEGRCRIIPTRKEDVPYLKELGVAPVSSETIKGRGGAVIISVDGAFRIDRTFDYLMEKKSDDLRKTAAGILFEEE